MSNANRTSGELRPCPHCGSGSLLVIARRMAVYVLPDAKIFDGRVLCEECGGAMLLSHKTRADTPNEKGVSELREVLRDRWNARAAVTDEQFAVSVYNGEAWQKVRTCGQPRGFIPCDSDSFGSMSFAELWCEHCDIELDQEWQFCPNCGAKVVAE